MITIDSFRTLALAFPEATEEAHFEKTSFRIKHKIFATYDQKHNRACIKLSEINQDVFCKAALSVFYPVNNKWGKQGWTFVELNTVHPDQFADALRLAYCAVAPKKLSETVMLNIPD